MQQSDLPATTTRRRLIGPWRKLVKSAAPRRRWLGIRSVSFLERHRLPARIHFVARRCITRYHPPSRNMRFRFLRCLGVTGIRGAIITTMFDLALWTDFFPAALVERVRRARHQQ